ncbi:MAG: hypothetical protein WBG01_06030, partial [Bacteroidota bacterium]
MSVVIFILGGASAVSGGPQAPNKINTPANRLMIVAGFTSVFLLLCERIDDSLSKPGSCGEQEHKLKSERPVRPIQRFGLD